MDLEAYAAPFYSPFDVRLGEYALLAKASPTDKVATIKGPEVHASVYH